MSEFLREVRKRLEHLQLEPTREANIAEEIAQHMEERLRELVAGGQTGEEARRTVMAELSQGDLLVRGLRHVERHTMADPVAPGASRYGALLFNFWKDLKYAPRSLRLNAGFSMIAILSLALGTGANTAIFQLLDAVRLRTLPVKNPNELVEIRISNLNGRTGHFSGEHEVLSNPLWEQIRDHQQAFSGALAWGSGTFNLSSGGEMRPAQGVFVSGDFFRVHGVEPAAGRVFTAADDRHGCGAPGVVISYPFWQREYGGAASAIGSALRVEGRLLDIIGVAPASFFGMDVGHSFDLAVPLCAEPLLVGQHSVFDRRDGWWLAAAGRLRPGWSAEKSTAHLESISPGIFSATLPPSYNTDTAKLYLGAKLGVFPAGSGLSALRQRYENPLWLLLGLAGAVLLIACANLANLTLARVSARSHEIAVRLALGASRFRLTQQLLMESLLLALTGAVTGVLLAQALTRVLVSMLSSESSEVFLDLALDWRVLAFTTGTSVVTCLLFGLTPALRANSTPPAAAMKTASRVLSAVRGQFTLRRVLVITQVALSASLLTGSLLFVRTFRNLLTLDAGFQQSGLVVTYLDLTPLKLPLGERTSFKKELLERVRAIPGVESAAEASVVPATGDWWNETVITKAGAHEVRASAYFNSISPGFFRTMATDLLRGRDVADSDTPASAPVVVVSETFIRKFLADTPALGATIHVVQGKGKPDNVYQIVGVAKDTKYRSLREAPQPIVYVAAAQALDPDMQPELLVRSALPLVGLRSSLDRALRGVSPTIAFQFRLVREEVRATLLRERLMATLSGFFGLLAISLSTIGLYGVISWIVVRRRNEIGIRMALGADRGSVLRLILREAATLLAMGLAVGTVLALATTQAASKLLFGLDARDPGTLLLAGVLLSIVTLIASYLPAHRAARLDPLEALREL